MSCMEASWFIENPASSVVCLNPRLRWLFNVLREIGGKVPFCLTNIDQVFFVSLGIKSKYWVSNPNTEFLSSRTLVLQVYKVVFNMKQYGSPTLKPTMLLTNNRALCSLTRAQKAKRSKRNKSSSHKSLCRKYIDSKGRPRFQGTPALKRSQTFDFISLCGDVCGVQKSN